MKRAGVIRFRHFVFCKTPDELKSLLFLLLAFSPLESEVWIPQMSCCLVWYQFHLCNLSQQCLNWTGMRVKWHSCGKMFSAPLSCRLLHRARSSPLVETQHHYCLYHARVVRDVTHKFIRALNLSLRLIQKWAKGVELSDTSEDTHLSLKAATPLIMHDFKP